MSFSLRLLLLISTLWTLQLNAADVKTFLSSKTYTITGTFGSYDFAPTGDKNPFDWAFTTSNGTSYQLQGNPPKPTDVFGWKAVAITAPTPAWSMFPADIDENGKTGPFEWILVQPKNNGAVYKLDGVSDTGTFKYSSKIDIGYTISGTQIIFEDINGGSTPAGDVESTAGISSSSDATEWSVTISFGASELITYKNGSTVIEHPLYFQGMWNAMISYNSNDIYYSDTLMINMSVESLKALNTSEITEFGIILFRYKDLSDNWENIVRVSLEFTAILGDTPQDVALVGDAFASCSGDTLEGSTLEKLKTRQPFEIEITCNHLTLDYAFDYTLSFQPN